MTQRDLAYKSGVDQVTISRIEKGHHNPRVTTARKLAEALDVTPGDLMASKE